MMRSFTPRKRTKGDNLYTPTSARKWRALVKAARYIARTPLAPTAALTAAAIAAERAVMPEGHRTREGAFWLLLKATRLFQRLGADQRQVEAPQLARLADAAEAALNGVPPGDGVGEFLQGMAQAAPRRHRADLDD